MPINDIRPSSSTGNVNHVSSLHGGYLFVDWYQKSTYSSRILHFLSNHPIHQKRLMIFQLVDKAFLLAQNSFHIKNINLVRIILSHNLYPK